MSSYCERCQCIYSPKRPKQRYCSNRCSAKANLKPQNQKRFTITKELMEEAEAKVPPNGSRLSYMAKILGCTPSCISYGMKRLGFQLKPRPRHKMYLLTTNVERRYVYSVGCAICGESRMVDAAHLIPCRDGGSGMVGNIIPLCPTHHRCYDSGRLTESENDLLIAFLYSKYDLHSKDFQEVV